MLGLDAELWSAVRLSLIVSTWTTVLSTPMAIILGYGLSRWTFRGKTLLTTICTASLVLPPVVSGFMLLKFFGEDSVAGTFLRGLGIQIPFTLLGGIIATTVVGFPLYILCARTAFDLVDERFASVALTFGKKPLRVFLEVTLPLATPGIVAGAILTFARSLGEFGATAILAGNTEGQTRTIALAVYALLDHPNGDEKIWTLVWFSLGISFVALFLFEALTTWQRRKVLESQRG